MNVLGMQGRGRERQPGVITHALAPSKCISCGQCAVVCPVRGGGARMLTDMQGCVVLSALCPTPPPYALWRHAASPSKAFSAP